jgi:hypothetical protein
LHANDALAISDEEKKKKRRKYASIIFFFVNDNNKLASRTINTTQKRISFAEPQDLAIVVSTTRLNVLYSAESIENVPPN